MIYLYSFWLETTELSLIYDALLAGHLSFKNLLLKSARGTLWNKSKHQSKHGRNQSTTVQKGVKREFTHIKTLHKGVKRRNRMSTQ